MADFLRNAFSRAREGLVHDIASGFRNQLSGLSEENSRKVFRATSFNEALALKTSAPFASDLGNLLQGHTPKYKFLFFVEVEFNEPYNSQISNEFTFMCNRATVPQVEYEYEEINFYNYFSKVPKRAMFSNCSFTFYDDVANTVSNFIQDYHRGMMPIVNYDDGLTNNPDKQIQFDSPGMFFKQFVGPNGTGVGGLGHNSLGPSSSLEPATVHKYASTIGPLGKFSSNGIQEGGSGVKNIMKKIRIYQIYTFPGEAGRPSMRANVYVLFNPKIISAGLDELSMEDGSSPSQWNVDVAYDTYTSIESVPIVSSAGQSTVPQTLGGNPLSAAGLGAASDSNKDSRSFNFNLYGFDNQIEDRGVPRYGSGNFINSVTSDPNEQGNTQTDESLTEEERAAQRAAGQNQTSKSTLAAGDGPTGQPPPYDDSALAAYEEKRDELAGDIQKQRLADYRAEVGSDPDAINSKILEEAGVDTTGLSTGQKHLLANQKLKEISQQDAEKQLGAKEDIVVIDKKPSFFERAFDTVDSAADSVATFIFGPPTKEELEVQEALNQKAAFSDLQTSMSDQYSSFSRNVTDKTAHFIESTANLENDQQKLEALRSYEQELKITARPPPFKIDAKTAERLTPEQLETAKQQYIERANNRQIQTLKAVRENIKATELAIEQAQQGG